MRLVLSNSKVFKQSLDAIAELITDAEFIVNEYGLSLKAIDPSQIALLVFNMPRDTFESFEVNGQEKIGLNIPSLQQIIKRSKNDDKIILEKKAQRLSVTLSGKSKRSFVINLLDLSESELPNPNINYSVYVKLKAEQLMDAVKDASLFASYLTIEVDNEKIRFSTKSSKGELCTELLLESEDVFNKDVKESARAIFSIDFLESLLKGASADTELELNISTNSPLKMRYKIQDASILYYLAPRIEE